MKLFDNAPGVEWQPDGPEATLPIMPVQPRDTLYPSACLFCESELDIQGYCLQCGQKAKTVRERFELAPVDWLAGVCDIGLLHARNEDALAIQAAKNRAVIVVCDGVTTSDDADVASLAAARTACDMLWVNNPQGMGTPSSRTAAIQAILAKAVLAANQAVVDSSNPQSHNSAASTIAIAVIDDQAIHCANLGDSRVYWLPDDGEPCQLTKDHSLAQDGIESGIGRIEAESSVFAHTITRWLGADAMELTPHLASIELDNGWLIVCSDGLWNYASEASAIKDLLNQADANDATTLEIASRMVAWANEQGGHDNITVACARLWGEAAPEPPLPVIEDQVDLDAVTVRLSPDTEPESQGEAGSSTDSGQQPVPEAEVAPSE